jgi:hypothetical protein
MSIVWNYDYADYLMDYDFSTRHSRPDRESQEQPVTLAILIYVG